MLSFDFWLLFLVLRFRLCLPRAVNSYGMHAIGNLEPLCLETRVLFSDRYHFPIHALSCKSLRAACVGRVVDFAVVLEFPFLPHSILLNTWRKGGKPLANQG